jgi:uncharacterized protein
MRPRFPPFFALVLLALWGAAGAQDLPAEKSSFAVRGAFERNATVDTLLRVPPSPAPLAAVMIVTSSPGFVDGRSGFYAAALNAAGFATLETDVTAGRGLAATPRHFLPHLFQALEKLAADPRIDAARIGVMGVSLGGTLALLSAMEELARADAPAGLRFAAHLPLYPVCWHHLETLQKGARAMKEVPASVYQATTGRPVHILVGDQDGYDGPDACTRFVAALPEHVRRDVRLTVYPGATFGWDHRHGFTSYERNGNQGRGAMVTHTADPEIARRSQAFSVEFFRRHLAGGRPSDGP